MKILQFMFCVLATMAADKAMPSRTHFPRNKSGFNVSWLFRSTVLACAIAGVAWAFQIQNLLQGSKSSTPRCKCMPTDDCWPPASEWAQLNISIGGNLVATHPIGSPCHDPEYDAEKCEYLKQHWTSSQLQ